MELLLPWLYNWETVSWTALRRPRPQLASLTRLQLLPGLSRLGRPIAGQAGRQSSK